MTIDLPLAAVSPLLEWLPGETLFSICSRHHRFWGYPTSSQSAQVMFGGQRVGTHHDLPSALDAFVLRTEGHLGTAEQLAQDRTLLRYYRPFVSASEVAAAAKVMRGPTVVHLKFRLGLLTSRFRANHPLKACASCMRADVERDGWVYWHLQHQYPGVWVCPSHREPLMTSTVKSTGVERFLWNLPTDLELSGAWAPASHVPEQALGELTDVTVGLVDRVADDGWLNPLAVQSTLRTQLSAKGWLTAGGSARIAEAAVSYLEHCAALRAAPELGRLASNLEEAKVQVGYLIRPFRAGTHPLRLLVAIHWLFGSATEFVDAHLSGPPPTLPSDDREGFADAQLGPTPHDARRRVLVELVRAGKSATAAAGRVKVDVATAMAWAAAAGIQIGRRPKVLKAEIRASLVRDLRKGSDKIDAAGRHGISIETVTRVLRTEVGLHDAWTAVRFSKAQERTRKAWLEISAQHHAAGTKIMRAMDPAAYAWLYRNDRAWLKGNSPQGRAASVSERATGVRWDDRDAELSRAVQCAALDLSRAKPGRQLLLWHFYQVLPELKPRLSALARLPLTKRALELALGRRTALSDSGDLLGS
jgi:hypothetical protein